MLVTNARRKFRLDPMLTDRQLWALGMIVCQWAMLEANVDQHAKAFFGGDSLVEYDQTRSFSARRKFWISTVKAKIAEPHRTKYLNFIATVADLQAQRDNYAHGMFGGVREPHKEHRHAGMIRNISRVKGAGQPVPTDFATMRDLAIKISEATMTVIFIEKELCETFNASELRLALKHICV